MAVKATCPQICAADLNGLPPWLARWRCEGQLLGRAGHGIAPNDSSNEATTANI